MKLVHLTLQFEYPSLQSLLYHQILQLNWLKWANLLTLGKRWWEEKIRFRAGLAATTLNSILELIIIKTDYQSLYSRKNPTLTKQTIHTYVLSIFLLSLFNSFLWRRGVCLRVKATVIELIHLTDPNYDFYLPICILTNSPSLKRMFTLQIRLENLIWCLISADVLASLILSFYTLVHIFVSHSATCVRPFHRTMYDERE